MGASQAADPRVGEHKSRESDWSAFITDVQRALAAEGLDAWLLYDFRGSNPIAVEVAGVNRQGGHLATRRWYYLIPADGEPRKLVHAIEKNSLAHLPGRTTRYA
ncbi:MAG TPA: hypothetical protein VGY48_04595, partial [Vicinamibacterales bacterium]|nr:hypothetical protein [Vicinamibacterales bacterium]